MIIAVEKLPALCRSSRILQLATSRYALRHAWKAVRRRRSRAQFAGLLEEELARIAEELLGGRYAFSPYDLLRQSRFGEPPRDVYCPATRDALVSSALAMTLSERVIERMLGDACYAYRRRRGPWRAVQALWTRVGPALPWFVCLDLRRFFYTMSVDWVAERILQVTEDPAVALCLWLRFTSGVNEDGVLRPASGIWPGDPLSGLMANWYLSDEDRLIASFLRAYMRYSDDLCGLAESRSQAEDAVARITEIVGRRGLTVKPRSVQVVDLRQDMGTYLGYGLTVDDLYVAEERIARLRRRLEWLRDEYMWRPDVGRRKSIGLIRGALHYYVSAKNLNMVYDMAQEASGWFPGGGWRENLDVSAGRRRGTGRRVGPAATACPGVRDGGSGNGGPTQQHGIHEEKQR